MLVTVSTNTSTISTCFIIQQTEHQFNTSLPNYLGQSIEPSRPSQLWSSINRYKTHTQRNKQKLGQWQTLECHQKGTNRGKQHPAICLSHQKSKHSSTRPFPGNSYKSRKKTRGREGMGAGRDRQRERKTKTERRKKAVYSVYPWQKQFKYQGRGSIRSEQSVVTEAIRGKHCREEQCSIKCHTKRPL